MLGKWLAVGLLAVSAYDAAAQRGAALEDLPIVEVPAAAAAARPGERALLAVLLSGDGGWATIDEGLSAALAREGIPVVGLNSLRYFWRERTPEELTRDLEALLEHYGALWGKTEVLAIGYSQGADVLPFALNRMAAPLRARISRVVLLAPSEKATFEFHLSGWFGKDTGQIPVAPELAALERTRVLCLYGDDDRTSLCATFEAPFLERRVLPGSHRFDGDYTRIATEVLRWLATEPTSSAAP